MAQDRVVAGGAPPASAARLRIPLPWRPAAVAICVPLRNEAALLPRLLDALAVQDAVAAPRRMLCVLLDACTDASERIVRARAASMPFEVAVQAVDESRQPNAGRARYLAMALAQQRLGSADDAALLTTDADSIPARDWIAANLRGLAVADVVAGAIRRDGEFRDGTQDRLERYLDRLHALRRAIDPVPWEAPATHHFTGGASLAFRASAYRATGGFQQQAAGEDAAIVDAAHRLGLRVRRDAAVSVTTSSRLVGRATGGLADHLRRLAECGTPDAVAVAHPADMAWQYAGQAAARRAYPLLADDGVAADLAATIGMSVRHVREVAASCANTEAFAIRVVPAAPFGQRSVSLAEAEDEIARLEQPSRERAA